MQRIVVRTGPVPAEQMLKMLDEHGVRINRYAEAYFSHPRCSAGDAGTVTVAIASLREIGLQTGASLDEIFRRLPQVGLKPCPPGTGFFLRLAWTDQPRSGNSVLSGTHGSPDLAVTVLTEPLEADDRFPKGLYLRNVDGVLWLRGYVCEPEYRFPADALFAFATV